ncbi:MAG: serine/threonine protein phosphatase [Clostridia bacterium]|nr:serine/threonine protein phosphatase [Clostridia bacterium]
MEVQLMKTFVVGDVHGCFQELTELLGSLRIKWGEDRLILLGDYIDRGSQEHEVLDFLQNLRNKFGINKIIPLRGNHEQMLLDTLGNTYHMNCRFSENEIEFLRSLSVFYEDTNWFYVHGGINPSLGLASQNEQEMLWIRGEFYNHRGSFEKKVAFGHTPTRSINGKDEPVVWEDRVALDTGCVFGGNLSAMEICDGNITAFYHVSKRDSQISN